MMEIRPKGSVPLRHKKREAFCRYYASFYWGRPGEAAAAAKYHLSDEAAQGYAAALLECDDVRDRVAYLRRVRAEVAVADDAWIRELLTEIATHAARDSDRIRALAQLAKAVSGGRIPRNRRSDPDDAPVQPQLPLFEGGADGNGDFSPDP